MSVRRADSTANKRSTMKAQPTSAKTHQMRATESATPAVITIRDARRDLPGIVEAVASGRSRGVAVGPRGKPNAVVVSYEVYGALVAHGGKKRKLALLITEELLGEAPQHIRLPAVQELSSLPMDDLVRLFKLDSLSLRDDELTAIKARMAHPEALDRLCQRSELATTLSRAREAGLYEAVEDMANSAITESESEE
jgi:prevent-host-death family protein